MRYLSGRSLYYLLTLATGALFLVTGCWPDSKKSAPPRSPRVLSQSATTVAPAVFVGSAACAECHPAEYKLQSHSRHAQTLFVMSRKELGKLAPPTGPIPGAGFMIKQAKDRFLFAPSALPGTTIPLDFAFGSGKTGMTYVFGVNGTEIVEFRSSYFPHEKKWRTTPGQEHIPADVTGIVLHRETARECFLCHAVTLPETTVTPQKPFFGVGCEACHGPGSAHIAAIRAGGSRDSRMEQLEGWSATRLNELCGRCHGTEQDLRSGREVPENLNRLQPVGLMRSQCFRQSNDTLSCMTCHDPHTDVSTNTRAYEAICLRCHSASGSAHQSPALRQARMKTCPVNAKDRCVDCHMPKHTAIAGSGLPIYMVDHQIHVSANLGAGQSR